MREKKESIQFYLFGFLGAFVPSCELILS